MRDYPFSHPTTRPSVLRGLLLGVVVGVLAAATGSLAAEQTPAADVVQTLEWLELLPANEREQANGLLAPPADHNFLDESGPAAPQEMSFNVNNELNGRMVKMPGFVVPLDLDDKGRVTEFFLVPYFGACIHLPPPPPNQIVYVVPPEPFALPSLYAPYWVTGRLTTAAKTNRLGASAYTVMASGMELYKD